MRWKCWTFVFSMLALNVNAKVVELKWKEVDSASSYEVQVSTDYDFQNAILSKKSNEAKVVADLPAGDYFLRVRAFSEQNKASRWSKARPLIVTPEVKTKAPLDKVLRVKSADKKIRSEWEVDSQTKNVEVLIIRDGKPFKVFQTTNNFTEFEPDGPGQYQVAIRTEKDGKFGRPMLIAKYRVDSEGVLSRDRVIDTEFSATAGGGTTTSRTLRDTAVLSEIRSAGSLNVAGHFQVKKIDSDFGVRFSGDMRSYRVANSMLFDSKYRASILFDDGGFLCVLCQFRFFLGAQISSNAMAFRKTDSNQDRLEVTNPSTLGATARFELGTKLGRGSEFIGFIGAHRPFVAGDSGRQDTPFHSLDEGLDLEFGARVNSPMSSMLLATLGVDYSKDHVAFNSDSSKVVIEKEAFAFRIGLLANTEKEFGSKPTFKKIYGRISPVFNFGSIKSESVSPAGLSSSETHSLLTSEGVEISTRAQIVNSKHGFRLSQAWFGQSTSGQKGLGVAEYSLGWDYLWYDPKHSDSWELSSELALATKSTTYSTRDSNDSVLLFPFQLMGPALSLHIEKRGFKGIVFSTDFEFFYPVALSQKSYGLKEVQTSTGYRVEQALLAKVAKDIHLGSAIGLRWDSYKIKTDFSDTKNADVERYQPYIKIHSEFEL